MWDSTHYQEKVIIIYASHVSEASKEERQTKTLAELFKQNTELPQPGGTTDHLWMIS